MAEALQTRVREQFLTRIAQDGAAVGFELKDDEGPGLLEPYEN
jgi:hypothetical protein